MGEIIKQLSMNGRGPGYPDVGNCVGPVRGESLAMAPRQHGDEDHATAMNHQARQSKTNLNRLSQQQNICLFGDTASKQLIGTSEWTQSLEGSLIDLGGNKQDVFSMEDVNECMEFLEDQLEDGDRTPTISREDYDTKNQNCDSHEVYQNRKLNGLTTSSWSRLQPPDNPSKDLVSWSKSRPPDLETDSFLSWSSLYDRGTDSSLSWADDECERETTEAVGAMFSRIEDSFFETSETSAVSDIEQECRIWRQYFPHLRVVGTAARIRSGSLERLELEPESEPWADESGRGSRSRALGQPMMPNANKRGQSRKGTACSFVRRGRNVKKKSATPQITLLPQRSHDSEGEEETYAEHGTSSAHTDPQLSSKFRGDPEGYFTDKLLSALLETMLANLADDMKPAIDAYSSRLLEMSHSKISDHRNRHDLFSVDSIEEDSIFSLGKIVLSPRYNKYPDLSDDEEVEPPLSLPVIPSSAPQARHPIFLNSPKLWSEPRLTQFNIRSTKPQSIQMVSSRATTPASRTSSGRSGSLVGRRISPEARNRSTQNGRLGYSRSKDITTNLSSQPPYRSHGMTSARITSGFRGGRSESASPPGRLNSGRTISPPGRVRSGQLVSLPPIERPRTMGALTSGGSRRNVTPRISQDLQMAVNGKGLSRIQEDPQKLPTNHNNHQSSNHGDSCDQSDASGGTSYISPPTWAHGQANRVSPLQPITTHANKHNSVTTRGSSGSSNASGSASRSRSAPKPRKLRPIKL